MSDIEPITREEMFYNKILGHTEEIEPITRQEMWLDKIAQGGGGGGGVNYSYEEHEVGTWLDGSIIYEKTYDINNIITSDIPITSPYNKIVDMFGVVTNDRETYPLPLPDLGYNIGVSVSNNNIKLKVSGSASSWSGYRGYITLRYTKE